MSRCTSYLFLHLLFYHDFIFSSLTPRNDERRGDPSLSNDRYRLFHAKAMLRFNERLLQMDLDKAAEPVPIINFFLDIVLNLSNVSNCLLIYGPYPMKVTSYIILLHIRS